MTKKLRIGCFLCALMMLIVCTLSGCMASDTDRDDDDDRDSGYVDNTANDDNNHLPTNNDSNVKSVPSVSNIEKTLQAKDYFIQRVNTDGADMEGFPSGVVEWHVYLATRFYDENANIHPFNYSESVENLMDSNDYIWFENVRIWYFRFDSVTSAQNEYDKYREGFKNPGKEGTGSTDCGSNWQQIRYDLSTEAANILICRIENVMVMIYADWEGTRDAGITYDNLAIEEMEKLGF